MGRVRRSHGRETELFGSLTWVDLFGSLTWVVVSCGSMPWVHGVGCLVVVHFVVHFFFFGGVGALGEVWSWVQVVGPCWYVET